jgi:hypothetical protein
VSATGSLDYEPETLKTWTQEVRWLLIQFPCAIFPAKNIFGRLVFFAPANCPCSMWVSSETSDEPRQS